MMVTIQNMDFAEPSLRKTLFELSDAKFELLYLACRDHTAGQIAGDITVQTCWDSDRLDLFRVGVKPHPEKLCTAPAKKHEIRAWANHRAEEDMIPEIVPEIWRERFEA
ncbi:MAG: hypothetical protein AAF483_28480 [Planctomycetota bacterium]